MKNKVGYIVIMCIVSIFFASCTSKSGFTDTELGFSFKRCTKNDTSPKAKQGDVVFGQMKILLNNKKEIYSNYGSPDRLFVISSNPKVGSIDEFLTTLHLGDSAIMIAPADSLLQFTKNIETRSGDKIYVYLTISQIISSAELNVHERQTQEKQRQEEEALTNYVLEKYDRAEKKESGLFYLSLKEGMGKKVEFGKRIFVRYSVTDTAGNLYDTNIEEIAKKHNTFRPERAYKPFDFLFGDDSLIPGWYEGLSYMKEGGRAILIIPSKLAYGEMGFGQIPPYTPLVFNITVVKVKDEETE